MTSHFSPFRVWISRAAVAVMVFAAFGVSSLQACPGCRTVGEEVERSEPQTVMAGFAFSWSVLFMLAVVFVVLSFLTLFITKTVKSVDRHNGIQ